MKKYLMILTLLATQQSLALPEEVSCVVSIDKRSCSQAVIVLGQISAQCSQTVVFLATDGRDSIEANYMGQGQVSRSRGGEQADALLAANSDLDKNMAELASIGSCSGRSLDKVTAK